MCAANQHQQFALNQCAIKQYVYQYQEWQCVWNQHVAKQNEHLNLAPNQYVAQQSSQSRHAVENHPQQHYAVNKVAQCTRQHDTAQQCDQNRPDEEKNHLNHGAVEPFCSPHDVAEQWDLNQCTDEEDCDFNHCAAQQYLVEQFPRNCYAGDAFFEEDVLNQFSTEQYASGPYFVEEFQGRDYELKQLEVDSYCTEQYNPSQYVGKHTAEYHQFADDSYTLTPNALEQYTVDEYTDHWYTSNQHEEAQNFMYNYAAKQCGMEEQYHNAAQQFAYGHYTVNQCTPEQYPTQASVGQFVAVQCTPYQYAVGQYFSDHYAVGEQYFPQQYLVNQCPEDVYVLDHYVVRQHTASQYKGDVCPLNQWPSGRFACGQYQTQHWVTDHDGTKLQAAVQFEAQQHALKYYALDQHALEQCALNRFEAEQWGLNHYATEQYALNQFEGEQLEVNQYLAEQDAINHQQHGLDQHTAEQSAVGRSVLGQCRTKQGVTHHSGAKQCSVNKHRSEICSTDQCPTQQDPNTQIEEKPGAPDPGTNQGSAELSAAKWDWEGKEAAVLNVATQEATQWDSTKPRIAEQDLENEKNQVPSLDGPEVVGTFSPHTAKSDTRESKVEMHYFAVHNDATLQYGVEQNVHKEVATEHKAPNCSGLSWSKEDCSLSHVDKNQSLPQQIPANHHNASAKSKSAEATTNAIATPCATKKKCSAKVEEPPADSSDKTDEGLEVTDSKISRQGMKPPIPDVAEQGGSCLDATEVIAEAMDSPEQKQDDTNTAEWDTAVQGGTELNSTELHGTGQDVLHQPATQLKVSELEVARQASSGSDLVERDAAKQNRAEQRGFIQDATGHRSTQPGARDRARTVQAQTGADDAALDTVGQIEPEGTEATTQVPAEPEPPDHHPGVAEQGPSQSVGDMNPPMRLPSDQDSAGRSHRRGTRSCRTGCSRASFNKGQSSRARYSSRSHYSSRYCND